MNRRCTVIDNRHIVQISVVRRTIVECKYQDRRRRYRRIIIRKLGPIKWHTSSKRSIQQTSAGCCGTARGHYDMIDKKMLENSGHSLVVVLVVVVVVDVFDVVLVPK